jgi:hypothetical protein
MSPVGTQIGEVGLLGDTRADRVAGVSAAVELSTQGYRNEHSYVAGMGATAVENADEVADVGAVEGTSGVEFMDDGGKRVGGGEVRRTGTTIPAARRGGVGVHARPPTGRGRSPGIPESWVVACAKAIRARSAPSSASR